MVYSRFVERLAAVRLASFRLFQSVFYRLGNASKTMEGIVRRASTRDMHSYSMKSRCLQRLKNVGEARVGETPRTTRPPHTYPTNQPTNQPHPLGITIEISPQKVDWKDRGSAGHIICTFKKIELRFACFSIFSIFWKSGHNFVNN